MGRRDSRQMHGVLERRATLGGAQGGDDEVGAGRQGGDGNAKEVIPGGRDGAVLRVFRVLITTDSVPELGCR